MGIFPGACLSASLPTVSSQGRPLLALVPAVTSQLCTFRLPGGLGTWTKTVLALAGVMLALSGRECEG